MKVRWNRQSLRLRITPSELESLCRREKVSESIAFPGGQSWNVALQVGTGETGLSSDVQSVTITLSLWDLDTLVQPQVEGVYFEESASSRLRYFVEKDFPCVHPRAAEAREVSTETFAAPEGFEQRKNEAQTYGK